MQTETFMPVLCAVEFFVAFMLAIQMLSARKRSHRNIFFLFFCLSMFQFSFVVGWFVGKNG